MDILHVLFGFHGRIRRLTYWLATIGLFAVQFVFITQIVAAAVGPGSGYDVVDYDRTTLYAAFDRMTIWWLPIEFLSFWIGMALAVKRAHDRNYPGIAVLLMFVPMVGGLWALIDLGFIDGTPGANQYGPSPKWSKGYY
jgi:uncharacterized membrane protein YhaH (DUF805 family)